MTLVALPPTSYPSLSHPLHEDTSGGYDWAMPDTKTTCGTAASREAFTGENGHSHSERTVVAMETRPVITMLRPPPSPKRKYHEVSSDDVFEPRPKRISPFLNTPKQRREERRKVLKISVQKLRLIDDPEAFLRRSVLINNTTRRLQTELREEKMNRHSYRMGLAEVEPSVPASCSRVTSPPPPSKKPRMISNPTASSDLDSYVSPTYLQGVPLTCLYDDPPVQYQVAQKITDDMTDILVRSVDGLEEGSSSDSSDSSSDSSDSSSDSSDSASDSSETNDVDMSELSDHDRQILGEMDIVFKNLLSVLSDSS